MEEWSNQACLGYALLAAKRLGYTEEQTKKLVGAMYTEFDFKTLDEAADVYRKS